MQLPPLKQGILIKRYKRFLADIMLPNGEQITIHCPNTGAMTGCATEGDRVWFSTSDNPKRKYAHTWELTETQQGDFICVNTQRANQLVNEALQHKWIEELVQYQQIQAEVKYGEEKSRIDFLLDESCFVEVKSTTLLTENGIGMFPDTQTLRGQKHLRELTTMAQQGYSAVIFFAILHSGIHTFEVAKQIDPKYAELFQQALDNGIQAVCYKAKFTVDNGVPVVMELVQRVV
ncbi:DNA/RNA nuclease SfsA [Phocoenobacter skyensis]|uniref:Sugar fermentation stimulation protein homolog n=1 Tax=Phocoenobacter skyensis TaxID=97481 RepID=A0A1H7ZQP4_9PAST|nr:DNA/RNA nuclease SfsA [Pasteurella skyensis]MDP8079896.1 DNA/RNA nuclease SfsA [Pasteurella skyensis]MDP8085782.1 DNA/RNA nuclease SfsA [Pasteurella skyensis]MDP8185995.1 DNA/RNA nuclease SfsA [Pasteurella skyensis]QLB21868.1 sugar fermentation stimulation protein SfsA [Pasteurella skyensis]SEM60154.1 sugar fermentation stimulation protein A [Pasteurella skyensis]